MSQRHLLWLDGKGYSRWKYLLYEHIDAAHTWMKMLLSPTSISTEHLLHLPTVNIEHEYLNTNDKISHFIFNMFHTSRPQLTLNFLTSLSQKIDNKSHSNINIWKDWYISLPFILRSLVKSILHDTKMLTINVVKNFWVLPSKDVRLPHQRTTTQSSL